MSARLCIVGPGGKMGQSLLAAASKRSDCLISALLARRESALIGHRLEGIPVTASADEAMLQAEVYIDFSTPSATQAVAHAALVHKLPAVIGTTGLHAEAEAAIAELAAVAPVVVAANFSLGVTLLAALAQKVAAVVGPRWDAEVVETHHRAKRDAPSGTALAVAHAIAAGHGRNYAEVARHCRDGEIGPRPQGEIGVATMRGGDVVGEHTAVFFGEGERLELTHRATSRSIFANGAIAAAVWVKGQKPGRYSMQDVLGLANLH